MAIASAAPALFLCPVSECNSTFHTVKFLVDHLSLYHGGAPSGTAFSCHINNCRFFSSSVEGYRLHLRREHKDEWSQQRYKRSADTNTVLGAPCAKILALGSSSADALDSESEDLDIESHTFTDYYATFHRKLALFCLRCREVSLIPKTTMESIVKDVRDIVHLSHLCLTQTLSNVLPNFDVDDSTTSCHLDTNEQLLDDIFSTASSHKQLKTYCKKSLSMIESKEFMLGTVYCNGKQRKHSFQYVSVLETLTNLLSHDDVAAEILKESISERGELLCSYRDGSAYKEHPLFGTDKMALRLHLYIDDFEVCNPIGSRRGSHKLTAVYFVLGNINPKYWSQSSSIHLAILVRAKAVAMYPDGLARVLAPLIADIKILETTGISVRFNSLHRIFRGAIATVCADNLASHQIGGFRESFSSGRMCRFCLSPYKSIHKFVTEENCVLRTATVHANHLEALKRDKTLVKTYGVKKACVFESTAFFSVTECLPPDVMHDILEGLCPINIMIVLRCLITSKKMTVTVFNEKLDLFMFCKRDIATTPPHLPIDVIKRGRIIGSASQIWCLFRNLPFLLGDVIEPDADYWQLHLLCREICKIVFAPVVKREWLLDLQQLIAEHHSLLLTIDPSVFTPKLHFLIHYPRLMEVFGPLKHLWCMRFEACHQYYKRLAKNCRNFRNIAHTLAERHQFKYCWLLSGPNALPSDVSVHGKQSTITVAALPTELQIELNKTFELEAHNVVLNVKTAQVDCVNVCVGEIYVVDVISEDEMPLFITVTHVIEHDGMWIVCGLLTVAEAYESTLDAYVVHLCNDYITLSPNELISIGPVGCIEMKGIKYVSCSYKCTV